MSCSCYFCQTLPSAPGSVAPCQVFLLRKCPDGPKPQSPASQLSSWSIPRRRAVAQWHCHAASHWSEPAISQLWLAEGLWAGLLIALPHHHSVCDGKCQTVATPPTSGPEPPLTSLKRKEWRVLSLSSPFGRGDHSAPMTNKSWSLSLDIVISDIDTTRLALDRVKPKI